MTMSTSPPTPCPGQFPAVADLLRQAKTDLTAFADFPHAHWQEIWSTSPLERLSTEVKRRTDVVGIFPNPAALLRLLACVLIEAHDDWQDGDRPTCPNSPWPADPTGADPATCLGPHCGPQPRTRGTRYGIVSNSAEQHARPTPPHGTRPPLSCSNSPPTSPLAEPSN